MAPWSNDIPACVMTWVTLLTLGQTSKSFAQAGDVKMTRLQFWAGSPDARAARAQALAVQVHHTFRDLFGAKFEAGKTVGTALPALVAVMTDKAQTIADLAAASDQQYRFLDEA